MIRAGIVGLTVLAVASGLATSTFALDSTSRQRNESFGWQAPNARMLNNKTEDQLNVNSAGFAGSAGYATSAGTATYSNTAGAVGYAATAGSATTAATAGSASSAGYASTAGNGVAGVSGSNLNLSNGTSYSLPSGGGGAACGVNWVWILGHTCGQYEDSCTGTTWGFTCN